MNPNVVFECVVVGTKLSEMMEQAREKCDDFFEGQHYKLGELKLDSEEEAKDPATGEIVYTATAVARATKPDLGYGS